MTILVQVGTTSIGDEHAARLARFAPYRHPVSTTVDSATLTLIQAGFLTLHLGNVGLVLTDAGRDFLKQHDAEIRTLVPDYAGPDAAPASFGSPREVLGIETPGAAVAFLIFLGIILVFGIVEFLAKPGAGG